MIKILSVFGTRPEVIKMAPFVKRMEIYPESFNSIVCISGQHREMIEPLIELFNIKPEYDLKLMKMNQTLEYITASAMQSISEIIEIEKPDYLAVQGDTTTGMAAALSAYYNKVKVIHIEAGLRSLCKYHPYPEEVNRKIIDTVSDLFFVHTKQARENLIREGVEPKRIENTGNTGIDSLFEVTKLNINLREIGLTFICDDRRFVLITAHRRESFGKPFERICNAILKLARNNPMVDFIYPVHLNPNVQNIVKSLLGKDSNIILIEPLDYKYFVQLLKLSYLVLTDSGGIQEEAPALGKPVLVMRDVTERQEAIEAGVARLVGTQEEEIVKNVELLLHDKDEYKKMSSTTSPYGDGKASERIVIRLLKEVNNA